MVMAWWGDRGDGGNKGDRGTADGRNGGDRGTAMMTGIGDGRDGEMGRH